MALFSGAQNEDVVMKQEANSTQLKEDLEEEINWQRLKQNVTVVEVTIRP